MSTWLWIALPLLFVVGLFVGALKDTKRVERSVKKNRDKMHLKDWDQEEKKDKAKEENWGVPPAPPGSYHPDDEDNNKRGG
ncbi:hypothetical protein GCM10011502_19260 [Oceanisphaera marina]|uniref:DUF2897 domain-containing protein n=1 Tax=Oceanisphaera marina TaxID=2017550 RepID=A0ABQ1IMS2_9GAMM|nr:hypothetical protein [Oceanisphaera marina]GGB46046.1 hypothetical protein GCM10011502_19260 [Oceanisphaera marina]